MTNAELLNEFNLLYDNIMSNASPGLNEYEISIFLTRAQETLVKELYSGKNIFRESFEKNEEATRSLSNLVRTFTTTTEYTPKYSGQKKTGLSSSSYFYQTPSDIWYIVREQVRISPEENLSGLEEAIDVVPITHDEFSKIRRNPFRRESQSRILRLSLDDNIAELISRYGIYSYTIRYLIQPSPIVLVDLSEIDPSLSVDGVSTASECRLHPLMHREIVLRAVNMAAVVYKQ